MRVLTPAFALLLLGPLTFAQTPVLDPADQHGGALYELDPSHSLLDFTARHLGFGRVRGTFNEYRAAAYFTPEDLTRSAFRVVVDVASLDTQNPGRDELLKAEFFAAEAHPHLSFTSRSIRRQGTGYVMVGDLQIRDVTREVAIPFTVVTLDGLDQWQNRRIALEGALTINRNDYRVAYHDNAFWDGIVSDSIRIDISFGAVRYNALNDVFPWRANQVGTVIRDGLAGGDLEATLARVRELHAQQPETLDFGFGRFYRAGWALYQQRRFPEARAVFDLAIDLVGQEVSPTELADFHLAIAEIEHARGGPAAPHIARALRADPHHPGAYLLDKRLG